MSGLLDAMRRSKNNWTRKDLEALYEEYGFNIRRGAKHDMAINKKYPQLRATLPNHKSFAKAYVVSAVRLVERLQLMETEGEKNEK